MPRKRKQPGFTLIELLVVMAIISLLASILMPTLKAAQNLAMRSQCLSNLRNLGTATGHYQADNSSYFWPVSVMNYPTAGMRTYFWGTNSQPVDFKASAFLRITGSPPGLLWCPSLRWGTYVPQGAVNEPTTTYGYNAWCLDPPGWGRPLPRKQGSDILQSASLFVFGDSAMFWSPGGVPILQNSTYLDPPMLGSWGANTTPTNHFRHQGKTNALCADGHAAVFDGEGAPLLDARNKLGFVGTANVPHYDIN